MQARFYAPWYGRFLSPDPKYDEHFEDTQGWNIYSYCENSPTMRIDPDGMDWIDDGLNGAYKFLSNVPVTGSVMRLTAAITNQTVEGGHVTEVGDGKARWSQAGTATLGLAVDIGSVASGGGVAATIKNVAIQTGTGVAIDTAAGSFNGGAHADMSKQSGDGLDSHHAPPKGTGGVSPGDGPSVQMEPQDHRKTTSYGRGAKADSWRADQQTLSKSDPRKMLAREAKDIRRAAKAGSGSATKYNGAMKKWLDYAKKIYKAVK